MSENPGILDYSLKQKKSITHSTRSTKTQTSTTTTTTTTTVHKRKHLFQIDFFFTL
jgi:hypothetical protein